MIGSTAYGIILCSNYAKDMTNDSVSTVLMIILLGITVVLLGLTMYAVIKLSTMDK